MQDHDAGVPMREVTTQWYIGISSNGLDIERMARIVRQRVVMSRMDSTV